LLPATDDKLLIDEAAITCKLLSRTYLPGSQKSLLLLFDNRLQNSILCSDQLCIENHPSHLFDFLGLQGLSTSKPQENKNDPTGTGMSAVEHRMAIAAKMGAATTLLSKFHSTVHGDTLITAQDIFPPPDLSYTLVGNHARILMQPPYQNVERAEVLPLRVYFHKQRVDHRTIASKNSVADALQAGYELVATIGFVYPMSQVGGQSGKQGSGGHGGNVGVEGGVGGGGGGGGGSGGGGGGRDGEGEQTVGSKAGDGLAVGTLVEARFSGDGLRYLGRVESANNTDGTYTIAYNDGDRETGVKREAIWKKAAAQQEQGRQGRKGHRSQYSMALQVNGQIDEISFDATEPLGPLAAAFVRRHDLHQSNLCWGDDQQCVQYQLMR
jgi:hypothetical protein